MEMLSSCKNDDPLDGEDNSDDNYKGNSDDHYDYDYDYDYNDSVSESKRELFTIASPKFQSGIFPF